MKRGAARAAAAPTPSRRARGGGGTGRRPAHGGERVANGEELGISPQRSEAGNRKRKRQKEALKGRRARDKAVQRKSRPSLDVVEVCPAVRALAD